MPSDLTTRIEAWRAQLLDTTKRNRLIKFQTGRTGGILLIHPDPGELWHRLVVEGKPLTFAWKRELLDLPEVPDGPDPADERPLALFDPDVEADHPTGQDVLDRCRLSPRLHPDHLLTELADKPLAARLARLHLNARESLTEQGVAILHVAFGFLRWYEAADSGVEIRSPLLLAPVRLERDGVESPWRLRADEEEILPNHSLSHLLASDFGVRLPNAEEEVSDDPAWRTSYFAAVEDRVRHHERWEVQDEAALGTFNFQKLAMWEDLGRNRERIGGHALCRAIAGDRDVGLTCPTDLPQERELDQKVPPQQAHLILDADSSQQAAVVAATRGADLVLDGPPGTGKSQTIANTIAEFLAAGKTVLFVSEKAAALEVVKRRLDAKGLGDFCLECHSHKANKLGVVGELGRCLALAPEACRDPGEDFRRLTEARGRLNDYVRELHAVRQPLGLSAFQAHGQLARLARLSGTSRCPVPHVGKCDAAYLRRVTEVLTRLPDCRGVVEAGDRHPWRGCRATVYSLTLRGDVEHHLGRLARCLARAARAASTFHELGFAASAPTVTDWLATPEVVRLVLSCPEVPGAWFGSDPRSVAEAIVQLDRATRRYRQSRDTLPEFAPASLGTVGPDGEEELAALLDALPRFLPRYADASARTLGPDLTRAGAGLGELHRRAAAVDQALRRVAALLQSTFPSLAVKVLRRFVEFVDQVGRLRPVPRSWWEAGRRRELQKVLTRCQEEARSAQELRVELVGRLSPEAFAPENAAQAVRAVRFRSFLARLFPGWWSFRARVQSWYTREAPKAAVLLDDLHKLAAYHRGLDFCRQVQARYAADLYADDQGQPDWAGTLEGLAAVDRLEELTRVPAALQATLSARGTLDREALAAAAAELGREVAALRRQLEVVRGSHDLAEVQDGPSPGHVRCTARELAAWSQAQAAALDRQALALDRVARQLAPGRDVPLGQLPGKLRAVLALGGLRQEIVRLRDRLGLDEATRRLEDFDWSQYGARAEGLLRFLAGWGRPLTPPVVRALTAPDVRTRLAEALRESDEARAGGFEESWRFLSQLFDPAQTVSTGLVLERSPLADLHGWLNDRVRDAHRINEWTLFRDIQREVAQAGVAPALAEVLGGQVKAEEAGDAFRARFLRLWLDGLYGGVPALRQFRTESQDRLIDQFRDLDRRALGSGPARIRERLLTHPDRPRAVTGEAPESSELSILLREVNKKRRHLPLRKLLAAIPTLLPRLKPCLMMSPLAVSTYLQARELQFDLVIIDEASQVRPHDAIGAIYRGRQLLVAGDQRQLPPTSFFERALVEEEEAPEEGGTNLGDFESVLDVCCTLGLLHRRLRWHYRSRREALIAFANHHVYDNELVTFPSVRDAGGDPAVAFEFVPQGRWKAGNGGGFNAEEARRTAELVLQHFRDSPGVSLGVIAFSQRQQTRILDELERLRRASPEMERFFQEEAEEPFFVKNLESVQGDEREVIFLSVGYGPDEAGRVAMRFGPLNLQGGERRLNVAVTRARERVTVLSSLRAGDIDLSRTGAKGVHLLRAYLDYAERGPEALRGGITEDSDREFDSPFEREVHDELTRRGVVLHRQVGCSGFRIDLAAVDPRAPGRYLLGVECDGATYHSAATARDRDRLRQEVLEGLGWRICRVWSTDWLRDREGQVRRVLAALERALQEPSPPPRPVPAAPAVSAEPETRPPEGALPAAATSPSAPAPFASIDEVPNGVLQDVLLGALRTYGATEATDLIQAVSRQLGFKRTGKRIQARIEGVIEALLGTGSLCRAEDQRLRLAPGPKSVSL